MTGNRSIRSRGAALALGLLALLFGVAVPAAAQEAGQDVLKQIEAAFEQGSVAGLLGRGTDRIDITILGSGSVYSRAQAQYVLERFFREHPPQRFRLDAPYRRDDNAFASGRYWYAQGESPLWVYIRLRREGANWELREIRIDRRPGD